MWDLPWPGIEHTSSAVMSESCSVVSNSLWPHGLYSPGNSPGPIIGVGKPFPSPGDLPNPGIEPRSPALQMDLLPAEPQGKPKNTGVGSLSLLQGICLTQGSNQGLLHCRQILYQLSYQGSPCKSMTDSCQCMAKTTLVGRFFTTEPPGKPCYTDFISCLNSNTLLRSTVSISLSVKL